MGNFESPVKERLKRFLAYKRIGQNRFGAMCGLSANFVNGIAVSIQPKSLDKISAVFPELNTVWLLTGEGEMIKAGHTNNVNVSGNVSGGVISTVGEVNGNNINISVPESGNVKIIRPDGTVEAYQGDISRELEDAKRRIAELESQLSAKNEIISMKNEMIEMLKGLIK